MSVRQVSDGYRKPVRRLSEPVGLSTLSRFRRFPRWYWDINREDSASPEVLSVLARSPPLCVRNAEPRARRCSVLSFAI